MRKQKLPPMSIAREPKSSSGSRRPSHISCLVRLFESPDRGEDYSILQAIVSIDMVVLFIATICGTGVHLAAIDNLSQTGEWALPPSSPSWAYGTFWGGSLQDLPLKYWSPSTSSPARSCLLWSSNRPVLAIFWSPSGSQTLYLASIIIGFSYGAQNPLLSIIISELLGLKRFTTLYNFGATASPVGTYIFNVRVTGHLYDREMLKQASYTSSKEMTCIGAQCFRLSFIIITSATALGALVMLILVWRTWGFYRGDLYVGYRNRKEVANVEVNEIKEICNSCEWG